MHLWIPIILILIILFVFVAYHREEPVSRFRNTECKRAYRSLVGEFGQPQVIVNHPGGFVMWNPNEYDRSIPFSTVILKDEQILHSPYNHYDFLYTTIIVDITESQLPQALSVNKNLYYDRVTRELTIRCNSIEVNKDTIYKVLQRLTHSNDNSGSLNSCITREINKINTRQNGGYNPIESFVTKTYKQIPVAP